MRIEAVETQLARLPLPGGAWRDAIQDVTHIELVVTDVRTETGLTGTGFSYTGGIGGRTLKAMLDHDIAPYVIGQPCVGLEQSPRATPSSSSTAIPRAARATIIV
jgi:L-alanine-DL-glutamate epimerase-like enolase superfamily enzyme